METFHNITYVTTYKRIKNDTDVLFISLYTGVSAQPQYLKMFVNANIFFLSDIFGERLNRFYFS